jgi:hypothetical protein
LRYLLNSVACMNEDNDIPNQSHPEEVIIKTDQSDQDSCTYFIFNA